MQKIGWLFLICTLNIQCTSNTKEAELSNVHLHNGLVVNIPFNNTLTEKVSGTEGINKGATFVKDRRNRIGHAVHFNRIDSAYIDFGDLDKASFVSGLFTISCWVYLEDTLYPGAIVSKRSAGGDFEYCIDNHFWNKAFYTFDNWVPNGSTTVYGVDPLSAKAQVKLNQWQHLVYVGNGSQLRVYSNGILQSGADFKNSSAFGNTSTPLVVGNGGGFMKNYFFQGAIDDIRMYNRVLSEEEILALFSE